MRFRYLASACLAVTLVACSSLLTASASAADETATLKVTFKLAGKAPAPKPLKLAGNFCGGLQGQVLDETSVILKDQGLI